MHNIYGVIKFTTPFEGLKKTDYSPEIKLFKSIIIQIIIDATYNLDNPRSKLNKLRAEEWLFKDNDHFLEICCYAIVDPNRVRKLARKIIKFHKSKQQEVGRDFIMNELN